MKTPGHFSTTINTTKTFDATREQIRYRLQAIISEPTMESMFCSSETKVDFFAELNKGSVILIDAAKDFLKTEGSANFSRLIVSLILKAILERSALPKEKRKPVLLFIDEAASCFSRDISSMLEEVRKYNAGVILAHQTLSQCNSALAASIHSNTSTKLCSGVSAADASTMAREMRCDSNFIMEQRSLHFALHIRNAMPTAVSITMTPAGQLPELDAGVYESFLARNRERISVPKQLPPPPGSKRPPTDEPHDFADDW